MVKFKIILVPFPFDDFSTSKVRPAICLTEPIGLHDHIIVAFISSKIPAELLMSDIVIEKETSSLDKSGLATDSVIRLHKMVTIPKKLIHRQLGDADKRLTNRLKEAIKGLFGV